MGELYRGCGLEARVSARFDFSPDDDARGVEAVVEGAAFAGGFGGEKQVGLRILDLGFGIWDLGFGIVRQRQQRPQGARGKGKGKGKAKWAIATRLYFPIS